jgi:large repetitive protein
MSWLRVLPVLFAATAIACEERSLDPDGGNGTIQTGNGGSAAGGRGGSSNGGIDARPDIITIQPSEPVLCGNGRPDPGEECDDFNKAPRDGCNSICQVECFESCGACGTGGPCVTTTFCGNSRLDAREVCDDWNNYPGDGCSADCATIEPGWRCPMIGRRCAPICGDGRVVFPETCDDGNTLAGDGCSEICVLEPSSDLCGDAVLEGSEECDSGSGNNDQAYGDCSATCRWIGCGDGVLNGREECDLGTGNNRAHYGDTGGCTAICRFPHFCGDGHPDVEDGEQCDLGPKNGMNGQPCTVTCTICVDCV